MKHQITITAIQYTPDTEQEIIDLLKKSRYSLKKKGDYYLRFEKMIVQNGNYESSHIFHNSWVVPNLEFDDEYLFIPNDEFIKRFNYDTNQHE